MRIGSAFARWSAISACLSSSNGWCADGAATAMPRLAPTATSVPSRSYALLEGGLDPRRDPLGLADAAHRPEQDPELVGAQPGDRVGGPRRAQQPLADLGEQGVAGGMAEALVDDLEPVEVEQDQRDPSGAAAPGAVVAGHRLDLLRQSVEQHRPVGQPGQVVVERGVGAATDLGLRALEQARVVERHRGQLAEPRERLDLAHRERA